MVPSYCGADRLHSKGRYGRRVRHLDCWTAGSDSRIGGGKPAGIAALRANAVSSLSCRASVRGDGIRSRSGAISTRITMPVSTPLIWRPRLQWGRPPSRAVTPTSPSARRVSASACNAPRSSAWMSTRFIKPIVSPRHFVILRTTASLMWCQDVAPLSWSTTCANSKAVRGLRSCAST